MIPLISLLTFTVRLLCWIGHVSKDVSADRTYELPSGYAIRPDRDDFDSFRIRVSSTQLDDFFLNTSMNVTHSHTCDFQRVDLSKMENPISFAEQTLRRLEEEGGPLIFQNAFDEMTLRKMRSTFSLETLRGMSDDVKVHTRRSAFLANHDGSARERLSFRRYAESIAREDETLDPIFEHNHDPGESDAFATLARSLYDDSAVPDFLTERNAMRIFSFGGRGMTVGIHNHEANFFVHAHGRKAWFVAPPGERPPVRHACRYDPRDLPDERMRFCVLNEGEILYLSREWWHATCNLDDWVAGYGAESVIPWKGEGVAVARFADALRYASYDVLNDANAPWASWSDESVCRPHARPTSLILALSDVDSQAPDHSLRYLKQRGCFEKRMMMKTPQSARRRRRSRVGGAAGPTVLCFTLFRVLASIRHAGPPILDALRFLITETDLEEQEKVASCRTMFQYARSMNSDVTDHLKSTSTKRTFRDAACETPSVFHWLCNRDDNDDDDARHVPSAFDTFLAEICAMGCHEASAPNNHETPEL